MSGIGNPQPLRIEGCRDVPCAGAIISPLGIPNDNLGVADSLRLYTEIIGYFYSIVLNSMFLVLIKF